jgi:multidrug efflux pump
VKLPVICIHRPVLAIVMTLVMVIVGAVSYTYLSLRHYPHVDKPIISVTTIYEGASPQIIESRVTKVLESALAGIEGVHFMTSTSEGESSRINIHFSSDRDIDAAASDVRDRISRVKARLPDGAKDSTIKKSDADAQPILYLALYDKKNEHTTAELYDYAHHYLENELEAIGGVAAVDTFGSGGHVMHVWLDPVKMAAYRVTTHDVSVALKHQNVHIPAGRLVGDDREFMVTTSATLKSPEAFNNVVIHREKEYLVKLKDIGHAEFSDAEERNASYYNDYPAISIGLIKKSIANPLEIGEQLKDLLPEIRKNLPHGMELDIAYDKTIFIKKSLDEVKQTFVEATIFVFFVILLFLWSFRAALIPLVTIPVSIITTCTLLYMFGFSLNTLTLLAIVLAIGLVVDDAIVMMENIHRYIEQGMTPMKAALKGSQEISFAIIAMTLTLAAVYAPIALSQGMVGKLFTEFALTLAGAVIVSGFVALTLSPMMCSRLLKPHGSMKDFRFKGRFAKVLNPDLIMKILAIIDFNRYYSKFEHGFHDTLKRAMTKRFIILGSGLALFLTGIWIGIKGLPSELAPSEDQGVIFTNAMIPQGATIPYIKRYADQMTQVMKEVPEVESRLLIVSAPNPMSWNILKPWEERKRSSRKIIDSIRQKLREIPGIHAYGHPGSNMISSGGKTEDTVQFVLQTTRDQSELDGASEILQTALQRSRIFPYLNTDRGDDTQEYIVDINRDKAALLGVDVSTIGETFDTFISGRRVTDFKKDSEQFDVIAGVREHSKRSPNDLSNMFVRGGHNNETMIPIANVVDIKKEVIPIQINHYNQLRSVTLSGDLAPGVSLGRAVETFELLSQQILPEGIRTEFAGETKQYIEARYTIYLIFGLALIFIYLVMAAQFESFLDPFIIMFSVPLSIAGALVTLKLVSLIGNLVSWLNIQTAFNFYTSINIYTQIGLITLIGLITKHGILIVEFANQIREEHPELSRIEAAVQATMLRLRPILMTTAAMVLGAVPLTLSSGAGAVGRSQLGWTIFGGMTIGTVFTLFIVPIIYTFIAPKIKIKLEKI